MTLAFRYAVRTHVGLVRDNNEDSGYAGPNLLMIADGMGGAAGGEVASAITIDVVRQLDRPGHTDPTAALVSAAAEANSRIARRGQAEPRYDGMGTTLTAGILHDDNKLGLLHIGDSRGYLLRDGDLTQFTHDHTFVQSLVDEGRLTEAQARHHPHRALIIRVLDGSPDHRPDLNTIELAVGDRLLFCSDGTEDIPTDEIAETLRDHEQPDAAAQTLIRLALRSGTSDNVTCVVADVIDGPPTPEPVVRGAAAEVDLAAEGPAETTADQPPAPDEPTNTVDMTGAVGPDAVAEPDRPDIDDEEWRYAPRPPRRFRWLTRTVVAVVVLGLIVGAGVWAYGWTQRQYYIGIAKGTSAGGLPDDRVAIYRGIAQRVPGLQMSKVHKLTPVAPGALPSFQRSRVEETIPADNLPHARRIASGLEQIAKKCRAAARERRTQETSATTPPPATPGRTPTPGRTSLPGRTSTPAGPDTPSPGRSAGLSPSPTPTTSTEARGGGTDAGSTSECAGVEQVDTSGPR